MEIKNGHKPIHLRKSPLEDQASRGYTERRFTAMKLEGLIEILPKDPSPADLESVKRAYKVAQRAHKGQKRASGEPYIQHCLSVARILAELDAHR